MTTYSYAQLMEIWIQGGGSKVMAPLMAAIAEVESSGNPDAENPSGATGLWQIEWPLYAGLVPGASSREAYHNPLINARAAVALSKNDPSTAPGSPVYTNWLEWEPPGAYKQYYKGNVSPSGPVPAAKGAAAGGTGTAQLDVFGLGEVADPMTAIDDVWHALTAPFTTAADLASSVTSIATSFKGAVGIFAAIAKDIEWLFVPSHWVRVGAFIFGTGFLAAGTWALMKTGSGQAGDITLSLGIMLIVIAAVLLFIAFHNLPTDIKNIGDLLGWISRSVRQGQAAAA